MTIMRKCSIQFRREENFEKNLKVKDRKAEKSSPLVQRTIICIFSLLKYNVFSFSENIYI
jgi:hypothetical protein